MDPQKTNQILTNIHNIARGQLEQNVWFEVLRNLDALREELFQSQKQVGQENTGQLANQLPKSKGN
jgi:hypothetical protein